MDVGTVRHVDCLEDALDAMRTGNASIISRLWFRDLESHAANIEVCLSDLNGCHNVTTNGDREEVERNFLLRNGGLTLSTTLDCRLAFASSDGNHNFISMCGSEIQHSTLSDIQGSQLLVVGDMLSDTELMRNDSFNVLVISTLDMDELLERAIRRFLETSWSKITMIICSDSLMPLVDLISHTREQARASA
ncbi:hypothetical protein HOI18_05165 [Candidatus Uhrbacteria bacterium]|jgi:hypothetical protein|nr:hypothetical protein [Candidatus Uhrbacteria bacterium]